MPVLRPEGANSFKAPHKKSGVLNQACARAQAVPPPAMAPQERRHAPDNARRVRRNGGCGGRVPRDSFSSGEGDALPVLPGSGLRGLNPADWQDWERGGCNAVIEGTHKATITDVEGECGRVARQCGAIATRAEPGGRAAGGGGASEPVRVRAVPCGAIATRGAACTRAANERRTKKKEKTAPTVFSDT